MLEGNRIDGKAEATGGRTGTFRLIRMAALDAAALHRFVGAYRFADGRFLLVDSLPGLNLLYAIDPGTGQVRAIYPMSETEFVSGPALLVPEPTEQTFSFDTTADRIAGVVRRDARGGEPERAVRIDIREESV